MSNATQKTPRQLLDEAQDRFRETARLIEDVMHKIAPLVSKYEDAQRTQSERLLHQFEIAKYTADYFDDEPYSEALDKFKIGLDALIEENAQLKAENAVRGGEWCAKNRAEGRGGCGACAWCCQQATERAERAEADLLCARHSCGVISADRDRVISERDATQAALDAAMALKAKNEADCDLMYKALKRISLAVGRESIELYEADAIAVAVEAFARQANVTLARRDKELVRARGFITWIDGLQCWPEVDECNERARAALADEPEGAAMSEPQKPIGCIDPCCALMPHGGMGVTGACKCLSDIALPGAEGSRARRKVLNALRWWQARTGECKATLKEAPDLFDESKERP
jgi:hypothetical protein